MIKKINLSDAFRNAMLNDPKASRKEAFKHFLETVRSNAAYVDALAEDYFYRMAANFEPMETGKGSYSLVGTPATKRRAEQSAERRADSAARVAKAERELKESIRPFIWLEMLMPNGKKLRHCTGAELAKFGGVFYTLSHKLKPNQVVDKHLSESDIRNVASQFEGKGRKKARAVFAGVEQHA